MLNKEQLCNLKKVRNSLVFSTLIIKHETMEQTDDLDVTYNLICKKYKNALMRIMNDLYQVINNNI